MTVKELIEELKKAPQDAQVYLEWSEPIQISELTWGTDYRTEKVDQVNWLEGTGKVELTY